MTGWRLGYAAAPQPFIQAMNRVHQYNVSCASAFGQAGAWRPSRSAGLRHRHGRGVQAAAGYADSAINGIPRLSCLNPGAPSTPG